MIVPSEVVAVTSRSGGKCSGEITSEWYRVAVNGEGNPPNGSRSVVVNLRCLAVHQRRSIGDRAAIGKADGLVPKANPKDRHNRPQPPDDFDADARVLGPAGPRRYHDARRGSGGDVRNRALVVADHVDLAFKAADELHQVVGEGIVIVDDKDHQMISLASFAASASARPLFTVSSYSLAGSESATMPAPAW